MPILTFDMVPHLFRPGIDVYVQDGADVYACIVKSVSDNTGGYGQYPQLAQERLKFYWLHLWYLSTVGIDIRRTTRKHKIAYFQGLTEIVSFPVCPAEIWNAHDGGVRRAKILQRSETHTAALQAGHLYVQYDGPDRTTRSLVRVTNPLLRKGV